MDFEQLVNYMIYLYPKGNFIYSMDNISEPKINNIQKSGSEGILVMGSGFVPHLTEGLHPQKTQK